MKQQPRERPGVPRDGPGHHWLKQDVVAAFVEQTTAHGEERRVLFDFACDLFPFEPDARIRLLDLGAGYGAFAAAVLDRFPHAIAVGLDLSEPMMTVGRERMARFGDRFMYHIGDLSGGELPADLPGRFDAVVTAAFAFHFPRAIKRQLYAEVFRVLNPGGCFVAIEEIAPPNPDLEAWYRERREREWQRRGDQPDPSPHPSGLMVPHHVETREAHQRHQRVHHVETEADQLALLRAAGFAQVDCFYKQLLRAVIGGYRPSASSSSVGASP